MYSGMVYCGMQAKPICICTYDGIKVGLLYNNAGYIYDVKCTYRIRQCYTRCMLGTISATMYLK